MKRVTLIFNFLEYQHPQSLSIKTEENQPTHRVNNNNMLMTPDVKITTTEAHKAEVLTKETNINVIEEIHLNFGKDQNNNHRGGFLLHFWKILTNYHILICTFYNNIVYQPFYISLTFLIFNITNIFIFNVVIFTNYYLYKRADSTKNKVTYLI